MICTEEEAKKKLCMIAFSQRIDSPMYCVYCVASDCMMWTWIKIEVEVGEDFKGFCGLIRRTP
jgi:hypothetical protein